MPKTALAIDFGSANTAAAFRDRDGRIHVLSLSRAGFLMPSAVYCAPERILVGTTAIQTSLVDPAAFEDTPKRRLADGEIFLAGRLVQVTDLAAAVLREVADKAFQVTGVVPDEVVLTHPDQWGPVLKARLTEAARRAGFDEPKLRMVSEATAAAWFYTEAAADLPMGARLAVFDFGAGTCDVAVLDKMTDNTFSVVAADGLDGLGGRDLDARIYGWVRRALANIDSGLLAEVDAAGSAATRLTLKDQIRQAKEALSDTAVAAISVPLSSGSRLLQLTRDEFEQLIASDIDRAVKLTNDVLAEANLKRPVADPVTIYLTGGSSAIPLVHATLSKIGRIGQLGDPKTVVAQGALRPPVAARPDSPPPPPPPPPPPIPTSAQAGWYPDPSGQPGHRYFDGTAWTGQFRPSSPAPPIVPEPPPTPGPPAKSAESLATIALVCSIAGLCCGIGSIVGIILGTVATNRAKEAGESRPTNAKAAVIVGWSMLGLTAIYLVVLVASGALNQ